MNWTTELPTEPGAYWMASDSKTTPCLPRICEIQRIGDKLWLCERAHSAELFMYGASGMIWYGPLRRPHVPGATPPASTILDESSEEEIPACNNCHYWMQQDYNDDREGECIRHPPVFIGLADGNASTYQSWQHPVTADGDICGEHVYCKKERSSNVSEDARTLDGEVE